MSAYAYHLDEDLPLVVSDEVQRLRMVDFRIAGLVLVPNEGGIAGPLKVVFATRRFSDLTGYEEGQIADRATDWLQGPETDLQALADLKESVVAGEEAETHLLSYTNAGDAFWARVQAHPLKRRDGTVEGVSVFFSPTTKSRASYLSDAWSQIEAAWTDGVRSEDGGRR
ncbi:MAG: PAS domain-containing protein [Parvibaculum sp.]